MSIDYQKSINEIIVDHLQATAQTSIDYKGEQVAHKESFEASDFAIKSTLTEFKDVQIISVLISDASKAVYDKDTKSIDIVITVLLGQVNRQIHRTLTFAQSENEKYLGDLKKVIALPFPQDGSPRDLFIGTLVKSSVGDLQASDIKVTSLDGTPHVISPVATPTALSAIAGKTFEFKLFDPAALVSYTEGAGFTLPTTVPASTEKVAFIVDGKAYSTFALAQAA